MMPLLRYFLFTGSVLLALLSVADRYLPPSSETVAPIDVDRSIIRIRSAQHLPEKIVFNTAHPPVVVAAAPLVKDPGDDNLRRSVALATDEVSSPAGPSRISAAKGVPQRHAVHPQRRVRKEPERRLVAEDRGLFGAW